MKKHRFINMYLTTTISVALVLTLIGIEVLTILSARHILQSVKENVNLTLVLDDQPDSLQLSRLHNLLQIAPFAKSYQFISKQQALEQHIQNLGEDPTQFIGYNPLRPSFEVQLNAAYSNTDSIQIIQNKLSQFTIIQETLYPKDVVSILDQNLERFSIIVLAVALILLFIAIALIFNTIRLHIYSKRFLINTMKLVGAKSWTIKKPFILKSFKIAIYASLLSLLILAAAYFYTKNYLNIIIFIPTTQNIIILISFILISAVIITTLAASIATGRYIRMSTNDLYYI
ncbi:MAG: permease-like cell division protein FtsX [Paludibacteraceae bacterium]|nr:permease-like cell division protein FtsX [Paludibacteraceae bacterium]